MRPMVVMIAQRPLDATQMQLSQLANADRNWRRRSCEGEDVDTREQLEAALAIAFDRHTLAVYADYLQSISDPRGELIALDLEIEGRPCPPELAARRTSLLHAWLGALVPADNVHRSWVGDSLRFGFIEDLE